MTFTRDDIEHPDRETSAEAAGRHVREAFGKQETDMDEHEADIRKPFTDGLRELADWFDAHPEVSLPYAPDFIVCSPDTRAEAAAVLLALKPCNKDYSDTLLTLRRQFGPITVKFLFQRDAVCVRRVVGHKEMPEEVVEARERQVLPRRLVEIVEWDCEPILAPRPAAALDAGMEAKP